MAVQLFVVGDGLRDFYGLILGHVGKHLRTGGTGPPHFHTDNLCRFSETDVLLQRRRAERPAAADSAIDRAWRPPLILHRHLDARSDGGAVRLHSPQPHTEPVVAVAGVFEETECVAVTRGRAADYRQNVFIAVVVDVREGHAVSLV